MKQRITYVVTEPESFNPDQIHIGKGSSGKDDTFTLTRVRAAKEHRITLGLDELSQAPIDIDVLRKWHEFHVRWAPEVFDSAAAPFTSRVSPGLHVFFTPSTEARNPDLCKDVRSIFESSDRHFKCTTSNETAIKMPMLSERFTMSTALQYYSPFSENDWYASKISAWFKKMTGEESTPTYIDIDYDAISQAVVCTAVWSSGPRIGWTDQFSALEDESTVEIGVLSHEPNTDPEDVQFGGFLTVLGRDDKPKPTRFQTPTRHYPLLTPDPFNPNTTPKLSPLRYKTSIDRPTGLHPTLTLTLPSEHLIAPEPTCKLHTHLTLPSSLFIDKYQFNDPLFLKSKNLIALRSIAGATDLEAPDWVVPEWGSAALFELASPAAADSESDSESSPSISADWNISIPLHLRYLPASASSHSTIDVPWPVVFWACRADEGEKHPLNPFDRRHLGYEALFGPKTRFMHVQPVSGRDADGGLKRLVETIDVPVLDTRKVGWVEGGTVGVVVLAFLGLCWVLFGKVEGKKVEGEKKKQ